MTGKVERITGKSLLRAHARALNAYMHVISTAPIEDVLATFDIPGEDLSAWMRATGKTPPGDSPEALRHLIISLDAVLDEIAALPEPGLTLLSPPRSRPKDITVHDAIGWLCASRSAPRHRDGGLIQAMSDYSHHGPTAWVRYAAALDPDDDMDEHDAWMRAFLRGAHLPQPT